MLLWIACGIAIAAALLSLLHLARRYAAAPARVPLQIAYDGRPHGYGPRALLWLAPAIVALVVAVLTAGIVARPPRPDQQAELAMVFVTMAEIAWLVGWLADRQIELARQITFRIAPSRLALVIVPLLGTIALTVAVAALTS